MQKYIICIIDSDLKPTIIMTTKEELQQVTTLCREMFVKKTHDYGASWRIMRPQSLTDQIFIKANRIRTLEETGENLVGEGIIAEFIGIVNYGIMGLIQLQLGYVNDTDMENDKIIELYDSYIFKTLELLDKKNHDYGEAWRLMRVSSYVDLILMKIKRTKQIEDHKGKTLVSEGIDANYMDMVNYSLFGLIKLICEENKING